MQKRIFDIAASTAALIVLSPILIAIAVLVWAQDRGPALFKQQRIGLNGRLFSILKFRSMVVAAPSVGAYWTSANDPRVTEIGRFLRRSSLDELPQLFNVLRGDMSLVGPRPDVPQQMNDYTSTDFIKRHSVKPGITGLAQALLRSEATADERLQLDLQYVEKTSILFDIKIIILTVRQVILRGGSA